MPCTGVNLAPQFLTFYASSSIVAALVHRTSKWTRIFTKLLLIVQCATCVVLRKEFGKKVKGENRGSLVQKASGSEHLG